MDDVVADFKGYAQHVLGYPFNEKILDEKEWNQVKSNQRLFRDLNPTIDAKQMMFDIGKYLELNKHISIFFLTAIPRNNDCPWAFYDKVIWANKFFPNIPVLFGPYSRDKYKHCTSNTDLLIDDRIENINEWISAGGTAYLYDNWDNCKIWLEERINNV
jgi:hypothetical protein